jgi:hypothetical protein
VAKERLEQDKYKAASTLALKKAEAEGDKLKVMAGLSPLEQAKIDKETAIGIATALSKRPVPMIVSGGGSNSGSGLSKSYEMENMILLVDKLAKRK